MTAASSARATALLGAALVLALSLVACGHEVGGTNSASPTPTESQTPSPDPEPELPEITSVRQAGADAVATDAADECRGRRHDHASRLD